MLSLPLQMGLDPHAAAFHHRSSANSFCSVLSISIALWLPQAPAISIELLGFLIPKVGLDA